MTEEHERRGFRPSARRRNRIAAGIALGAIAIGGNVLVYSSVNAKSQVVQAVQDIPAGSEITADMLRVIDVELDSSVIAVSADDLGLLPGRYAKVRIVSGSLVVDQSLQFEPLVTAGRAVVAVRVADSALPIGLRERSTIQLVLPGRDDQPPAVIDARTVGLPISDSATAARSLSVEVDLDDAPTVAAGDDVRVVLIEPVDDPAATTSAPAAISEEG